MRKPDTLSAAALRRWALDLEANYPGKLTAEAAALHLSARADLMDAEAGTESGIAPAAIIIQQVPLLGRIEIAGGKIRSIERPYHAEGERIGIHVAFEWLTDPGAEERAGQLIRMYLGSSERGPLAQYDCSSAQWYALTGRGNHGKRYACGGNWSSNRSDQPPAIMQQLEAYMDRIAQAKAKLAAAELRVKAAGQRQQVEAYYRQAANPAYPGQEVICLSKAAQVEAIAMRTEAEADLILAEAGV
jgi:hypothetical protein